MENDERNEGGKMTAEKILKMLKDEGIEVTLEQAEKILDFLRLLANLAVSKYFSKNDKEDKLLNKDDG